MLTPVQSKSGVVLEISNSYFRAFKPCRITNWRNGLMQISNWITLVLSIKLWTLLFPNVLFINPEYSNADQASECEYDMAGVFLFMRAYILHKFGQILCQKVKVNMVRKQTQILQSANWITGIGIHRKNMKDTAGKSGLKFKVSLLFCEADFAKQNKIVLISS